MSSEEEYERADAIRRLTDHNPSSAIEKARALPTDPASPLSVLRAATLVDAGALSKDADAVAEGTRLFRDLAAAGPEKAELTYNLANGLVASADLDPAPVPDWYSTTVSLRHEARRYFARAARADKPAIATQALTNLGNALDRAHRWVEAYDMYVQALQTDPANGVASGCAAQLLHRCLGLGLDDRDRLTRLALGYARHSHEHVDETRRYGGQHAVDVFSRLPGGDAEVTINQDTRNLDPYPRFAVVHRLVLTPFVEAADLRERRWDTATIRHFTEPMDAPSDTPAIFAMFNTMKEDFLLARYIAYTALEEGLHDPGTYIDTLDYATYGTRTSALRTAQRLAIDVLDKIASAVNAIFDVGLDPMHVNFINIWRQGREPFRLNIRNEMHKGNRALIALSEVCEDLTNGGYLEKKRSLRHSSTHRFTVLHDMIVGSFRSMRVVEHYAEDEFRLELMETLRLCRAALLYFVEAIHTRELTRGRGPSVPLVLPLHHEIRREGPNAPSP